MRELNYSSIEGRHTVHSQYVFEKIEGVTCLCPGKGASQTVYDPLKSYDVLLLYAVAVAEIIISCAEFWKYCVRNDGAGTVDDTLFWENDDFFGGDSRDSVRIKQMLLNFANKYGVPEWEAGRVIHVEVPDRYAHLLGEREQDSQPQPAYSYAKNIAANREAIPAGSMALMMVCFYDRFILQKGDTYMTMDRLTTSFRHDAGHEPELTLKARGLVTCINMAYILLAAGRKSAIRKCKRCGRFFIADDLRTEYCGKKCRGAYNSAMTRKRKREEGA